MDNSALRLKFPPCLRSGDYPVICEDVRKCYEAPHQLPPVGGGLENTAEIEKKVNSYRTAHPDTYALLKAYSLENRHDMTDAESVLWEQLKAKQLGAKFRRQHVIGDYIADFVCLSHHLVVEVDGEYHDDEEQKQIDQERTDYLNSVGFDVIRFTNNQILFDTDEVLNKIRLSLKASPTGGGLEEAVHVVFSNVNLTIKRGEKVAFVGKNGEGKTTLVKCIMGEIPFDGMLKIGHNVQIGYFAQNQAQMLDESLTVFETIDRVARGDVRLRINDILGAFMFGGEESDKRVKVLSGGERSRLAKAFDGTAIIVSHDREFLDGLVSKVYEFGGGKVREHLGGIYDWIRKSPLQLTPEGGVRNGADKKEASNATAELKPSPAGGSSAGAQSYQERKETMRRISRLQKSVKETETKIENLEKRMKELDAILCTPEGASDMTVVTEYTSTKKIIDQETDRWEQLSTELEELQSEIAS